MATPLSRERWGVWGVALLVVALAIPAAWPFASHAGYWESHDGAFHLYRLLSLQAAWGQGQWYPRLFPDFAFGYGFAVLHYYGPLAYYVALALAAFLSPVGAMKAAFALSYPLAALAAWWLARDLWRSRDGAPDEFAGLAASVAYTYAPYHMADVQLRGALAESWAFVWLPLLFWAVWRARPWPLALSLAALVLTHNLTVALAVAPLAAWAAAALWQRRGAGQEGESSGGALARLAAGGALALGLSAFYWLPVLLESRYVFISQDIGGEGFARHLAPLREWLAVSASYRYFPEQQSMGEHPLSWAQAALLAMALLVTPLLWRVRAWRGHLLFWTLLLALSLFLLTPASLTLWRAFIFPLGLVQYPWRWLGMSALATAMLAGALFTALQAGRWRAPGLAVGALLLVWLAYSSMEHLPWRSRAVEVEQHPVQMWEEDAANGQVGATWTAEFLPLTVTEQRWALARAPEVVEGVGRRSPLRVTRAGGDGFTIWVEAETPESARLIFPRFLLPSMHVTVDGEEKALRSNGPLGLAAVDLPAGRHLVRLEAIPMARYPWLTGALWLAAATILVLGTLPHGGGGRAAAGATGLLLLALWARAATPPPGGFEPALSEPVLIGEQAQLVDARLVAGTASAGETLQVMLHWFNLEQTEQEYASFLHLTAPGGGAPLAQHDAQPNMTMTPTSRWLPGQLIEDRHLLSLPDQLPAGEYELWAGMYQPTAEGARPLPGDSGERRLVGRVTVGGEGRQFLAR